jgi:hypothetical protein
MYEITVNCHKYAKARACTRHCSIYKSLKPFPAIL